MLRPKNSSTLGVELEMLYVGSVGIFFSFKICQPCHSDFRTEDIVQCPLTCSNTKIFV